MGYSIHEEFIYTFHDQAISLYNDRSEKLWTYNISNDIDLIRPNENRVQLLHSDDDGAYLFYIQFLDNTIRYTLGLFNENGLIKDWDIKIMTEIEENATNADGETETFTYNRFDYAVSLTSFRNDRILTFLDASIGYWTSSNTARGRLVCVGQIFEITQQNHSLLLDQKIDDTDQNPGCHITNTPESFVYESSLYLSFYANWTRQIFFKYSPSDHSFQRVSLIDKRQEEIAQENDNYEFLSYFITNREIYYLYSWNTFEEGYSGPRALYIFNNNGLVAQVNLQDITPSSFLENARSVFVYLAHDSSSQMGAYSGSRYNQIDYVQLERHRYLIPIAFRSFSGELINLNLDFQAFNNSISVFNMNYTSNTSPIQPVDFSISLGIDNFGRSLLTFSYQISDNSEWYVLQWNNLMLQNIPAKIEQIPTLPKYLIPNLITMLLAIIILFLKRNHLKTDNQLYP